MEEVKRSRDRVRYVQAISILTKSPEMDIELCREIFWQLRSDYLGYGVRINRWVTSAVIAASLFVLLSRNLITSASISGIQLDHLSFLAYFLPPAVAFCILNIVTAADEQGNYEHLMMDLTKTKLPGLRESRIDELFTSGLGLFSSDVPDVFLTRLGKISGNLYVASQVILLLAGYIGFEIFSYMYLLNHLKGFFGIFISLIVTVSLAIMTAFRFVGIASDPAPFSLWILRIPVT
jgi:hypothetical protein